MNVLLVHDEDKAAADDVGARLTAAGHVPRSVAAAGLSEGGVGPERIDVIIVLVVVHREKEAYEVCRQLRESDAWRGIPLLVAITIYQMPLANRVKAMPNAHFIFTPVNAEGLAERVQTFIATNNEQDA